MENFASTKVQNRTKIQKYPHSYFRTDSYFVDRAGGELFIGEYTHSIDPKGRIAVPSKMRRELGSGAVITRGLDRCLWVFTKKEWENLAGKLAQLPISDPKSRAFSRLMLAGAMEVDFDIQGRALIPGYLKEYANLAHEAVIAGLYNRLEIWDKSVWKNFKEVTEKQTDEISKHMMDLGV